LRTLDGRPLFFRLHAGWWLSSFVRAAVFPGTLWKEIRERRQIKWRLRSAQRARTTRDFCVDLLDRTQSRW